MTIALKTLNIKSSILDFLMKDQPRFNINSPVVENSDSDCKIYAINSLKLLIMIIRYKCLINVNLTISIFINC